MSKKPFVRVCVDGLWIWDHAGCLAGIGVCVFLRGHGYYFIGILVPEQKIDVINLSRLAYGLA